MPTVERHGMEYNHKIQLNYSTVQHQNFEKNNKTKCHVDYGFKATIKDNTDWTSILAPTAEKVDVKFDMHCYRRSAVQ